MKKIVLNETQLDRVLSQLITEDKLHDKAFKIANQYYPELTQPQTREDGRPEKPVLSQQNINEIINQLTANQAYSTHNFNWLLEIIKQKSESARTVLEDLDVYARYLRVFEENKQKIIADGGKPDLWQVSGGNEKILNYKNIRELYDTIRPFLLAKEVESGDMLYPMVKRYTNIGDFEFVGETPTWYVVKLKKESKDAVIAVERGPSPDPKKEYTTWCTRVAGSYFDSYMNESPLFLLVNKQTAKTTNRDSAPESMLQFHFARNAQYMDRLNHGVNLSSFWEKYPDVYGIFHQGVIDVIMDPELTPLFRVNIDKTNLTKELKAMYKYKLESKIIPAIAEKFRIKESELKIIEHAKYAIFVAVKVGEYFDLHTKRKTAKTQTYLVMPSKFAENFMFAQTKRFKKLLEITNLMNPTNPSTWVEFIDYDKFLAELKTKSNDDDFIIKLKQNILKAKDLNSVFANLDLEKLAEVIDSMDVIDEHAVVNKLKDPANTNLSLHMVELGVTANYLITERFSEIGLTMQNFLDNSKVAELVAVKLKDDDTKGLLQPYHNVKKD